MLKMYLVSGRLSVSDKNRNLIDGNFSFSWVFKAISKKSARKKALERAEGIIKDQYGEGVIWKEFGRTIAKEYNQPVARKKRRRQRQRQRALAA